MRLLILFLFIVCFNKSYSQNFNPTKVNFDDINERNCNNTRFKVFEDTLIMIRVFEDAETGFPIIDKDKFPIKLIKKSGETKLYHVFYEEGREFDVVIGRKFGIVLYITLVYDNIKIKFFQHNKII